MSCTVLSELLETCSADARLRTLRERLLQLQQQAAGEAQLRQIISLYQQALDPIEKMLWEAGMDDQHVARYQALFRELESHISLLPQDDRHDFIIVIPVADRPMHLDECLNSVLQLCRYYQYGGMDQQGFSKLMVLIADDSAEPENIARNQQIAGHYTAQGMQTKYFGQQQQQALIDGLPAKQQADIRRIIGAVERDSFYHKGASITRNITYLKLQQLAGHKPRTLFYFIDSDQEFRVSVANGDQHRDIYAINYFYQLDRIFTGTGSRVLTGKVVGDPPVSPAVMAGNFLDDVIAFLEQISDYGADQACRFHDTAAGRDEGAYHDMGELFGFTQQQRSYRYPCPLQGAHDHRACFTETEFAHNINRFFDGEHATRKTVFDYHNPLHSVSPARTIYTGNYVLTPQALAWFIPFATLKLRMAGPVLGRFMRAELAEAFVSAALPMLHKRTVDSLGQSEYRAGIAHQSDSIDLSAEFERQYYGDVMLFSVEKLSEQALPAAYESDMVRNILVETEQYLHGRYLAKHDEIVSRLAQLHSLLEDQNSWWRQQPQMQSALQQLARFIDNMERNFGEHSKAFRSINDQAGRDRRIDELLDALMHYNDDRQAWQSVLHGESANECQ